MEVWAMPDAHNLLVFIKTLIALLMTKSTTDFVVTGLKMQYESPSQDPRLTVDERLKLLYPMVNVINKKMLCALKILDLLLIIASPSNCSSSCR